ncbi:Na+-driven multidrug efflux pump [Aliiruegeria haliotis]|uniref:Na+-driven multidrug efflux pump n=1 Tax=Aliiruegeria haliotis TaxID=1280846 RepID=A0A2T0RV18_9RHOB|nr:MATE family efflux transporter [Aliiruegeria haliotis]PRY25004.1 Na+-driven multidrug efflux pump [Aliiruegeria haliotis]
MTVIAAPSATPSNVAIFRMAWPLGLKAMMLHGIVVIDAWLVSALGEPALAAMGLAASIAGLILGTLMAFSNAAQVRIAQAYGSGDPVSLKTGLYVGILINVASAALGIGLVALFGDDIIRAFAHTPWIADQAISYLQVFLLVVVFEAFGQVLGSHFNGCGKTLMPAKSYLLAIPINVVTSYVLIHGHWGLPELGVSGAAVGSAIAAMTRMLFLGAGLWRMNRAYLGVEGWRNGTLRASIHRHLVFALPIAGTFISMTIVNNICMLIYAKMSVNDFAAMTLIQPWVLVAGNFSTAWGMATGIAVAQLLGSNVPGDDLVVFLKRAWRGAFVAAIVVSLCFLGLSLSVQGIYGQLEAQTRAALWSFLPFLLVLPFPRGSNLMCGHTLRASGDTVYPMKVHVCSQWLVRLPLTAAFILWLDLSVTWVFALVLFEEFVKLPFFHSRILKGEWKKGLKEDD